MSQKTDNLIKLALVFFVSLLSFSIGTYVGKKYSDNQHKLSALEPKKESPATVTTDEFAAEAEAHKAAGEQTAEVAAEDQVQKPGALTDSEVAKIAEEFATEDEVTDENIVASITEETKDVKVVDDTGAAKPVVTTQAAIEKVKQQMEKTEERIPASLPAKKEVASQMHFTVQVGSFPTLEEAEKLTQSLQSKGYKTTYVPAKVNGQTWYRVNVGLFGSVKEAQDYKKDFLDKTKLTSAIVQRVQQ